MSEILKIRLAARTDAAGRSENEDNFQVAENLSVNNMGFEKDKVFSLGSKGTLLLVCDGMGGMNAGEVASAVGVETIKNLFASHLLTSDVLSSDESICAYMKRAIVKADSRIKEEANKDEAKHGMGSTAVMAWLLGQKVYVAWCGDSRCYRYNPATGLEQLSHDHSYVQDLVDTGQLSAELAFDHPNKNIITRSLGDPRGAARPDAKVYDLHSGDVILLCSDGLSDSLRDEEIEQSISRSLSSMAACLDALWSDSYQAGWHDNVTVVLAQVIDEKTGQTKPRSANPTTNSGAKKRLARLSMKFILVFLAVIVIIAGIIGFKPVKDLLKTHQKDKAQTEQAAADSLHKKIVSMIPEIKSDTTSNQVVATKIVNMMDSLASLGDYGKSRIDTTLINGINHSIEEKLILSEDIIREKEREENKKQSLHNAQGKINEITKKVGLK